MRHSHILLHRHELIGNRSAFFEDYIGRRGQPEQTDKVEMPGAKWAERARNDVLLQIHSPTIQHLMVCLKGTFRLMASNSFRQCC